jgi:hypothetical protein
MAALPVTRERGCQKILRNKKFVVPAQAGTQGK